MNWESTLQGSLHLQTQLQDGFRLTFSWSFSYIFFSSFTFPGAPYRIFLLLLPWLPCHLFLVVIEQQRKKGKRIYGLWKWIPSADPIWCLQELYECRWWWWMKCGVKWNGSKATPRIWLISFEGQRGVLSVIHTTFRGIYCEINCKTTNEMHDLCLRSCILNIMFN